ncbi:DUF3014 domain-containing protein [Archangium violaceum]|uniref:DUF3014 domain-containing protein n=1 Tax=Archangium violaceum TaxID=83451 RepID=UPI002B31389E|nr:DUF3014 domain-containing protein [Archangium violaceum]
MTTPSNDPNTNVPLPSLRGSPRASRRTLLAAVLLLAVLGGAGGYLLRRQASPPAAERTEPVAQADTRGPVVTRPEVQLSGTDPRVRELLRGLSGDAGFLRWLSAEDLVRRFVSATSAVAEGQSPREQLSFMAPTGGFQVTRRAGRTVVAPESYARFDGVTRALVSVNTQGVQRVYQELKPLLDAAHAEIAPPGRNLEQGLTQALGRLTRVPVPTGAVEVTPKGALYAYADPRLEALSGAEKHLLRMGPENMRKVQTKLSELAHALGLSLPEQAKQPVQVNGRAWRKE